MLVRLIVGLCHEEAMKVGKSGLGWAAELGWKQKRWDTKTLRLHRPRLVLSTSLLFCFLNRQKLTVEVKLAKSEG
jgi:hypothetical protein